MRGPLLAQGRAGQHGLPVRPPAGRARARGAPGTLLALDPRAERTLAELALEGRRSWSALGAEREGLPAELLERAAHTARIPLRDDGPESLNVAMAATVALYELANRMARHA